MCTIQEAIGFLRKYKEEKVAKEAAFKEAMAPINANIAKLESAILNKMAIDGVQSYKTESGTAYRSTRVKISCPDKAAFMDFVKDNNMFELLEVRPLKSAVEEYKTGRGVLPPGVDYNEEITLNFRKA